MHLLMSKTQNILVETTFFTKLGFVPKTMAYIPSKSDSQKKYFNLTEDYYKKIGVSRVLNCDLDLSYSPQVWDSISSADIIYLSGGFTPYFLSTLKKVNGIEILTNLNKPLIGVSAGALIMGSSFKLLFDDPDEGPPLKLMADSSGMKLYNFEFWPHFGRRAKEHEIFIEKSKKWNRTILACDDESGIIIDGKMAFAVGHVHQFRNGTYKLNKHDQKIGF